MAAPGVQAEKLRPGSVARLVNRAGPETAQRIGLTVVEARGGRVVLRRCEQHQIAPPLPGAVDAVAQGDDQACALAIAAGRRNAARLGRQRPAFDGTVRHRGPADLPGGNVHPIQALLVGVPERRFAQFAGL